MEGVDFRSALDSAVRSLTADGIKCIFHDESVGVDLARSVASYLKQSRSNISTSHGIQWLTSGQVAAAVMSLTAPTFSDDLRNSLSQFSAFSQQSQSQSQLHSQLHSQLQAFRR